MRSLTTNRETQCVHIWNPVSDVAEEQTPSFKRVDKKPRMIYTKQSISAGLPVHREARRTQRKEDESEEHQQCKTAC